MKEFIRFMASSAGRLLRIVVGVGLILWGALFSPDTNWLLIIIGLIPLSAGLFDFCLLAPHFGYPFGGAKIRSQLNSPH